MTSLNKSKNTLLSQSAYAWLPLHHSIRNLSLEYQVDGNYLEDLAQWIGLRPMLAAASFR
jgi:hypothetical protein